MGSSWSSQDNLADVLLVRSQKKAERHEREAQERREQDARDFVDRRRKLKAFQDKQKKARFDGSVDDLALRFSSDPVEQEYHEGIFRSFEKNFQTLKQEWINDEVGGLSPGEYLPGLMKRRGIECGRLKDWVRESRTVAQSGLNAEVEHDAITDRCKAVFALPKKPLWTQKEAL